MKKNNGFTLIELLATIIILAGIALVAFPILLNTIKNSEGKIDSTTRKLVENAAKLYVDNNANDYPKTNGNTYCVAFNDLINSKHLEKGLLEAADVDYSNKVVKVNVTDNYDYEIVNSNECTVVLAKICTYKGTDVSKKYEYGAEYTCELGDGISRTFYMLEDGDDPTLTKGDFSVTHYESDMVGTAGSGEVALIMDSNYDNTTQSWCKQSEDKACNADGLTDKLDEIREAWTKLEYSQIVLPTYAQIYVAAGKMKYNFPDWLKGNLDDDNQTETPYLYWTSTAYSYTNIQHAWYVRYLGDFMRYSVSQQDSINDIYGVRPVITISKDEL